MNVEGIVAALGKALVGHWFLQDLISSKFYMKRMFDDINSRTLSLLQSCPTYPKDRSHAFFQAK